MQSKEYKYSMVSQLKIVDTSSWNEGWVGPRHK